jgi:hypothetical protein
MKSPKSFVVIMIVPVAAVARLATPLRRLMDEAVRRDGALFAPDEWAIVEGFERAAEAFKVDRGSGVDARPDSGVNPAIVEDMGESHVVGLRAASRLAGVSHETVREWCDQGILPYRRPDDRGPYVFDREDLEAMT